MKEQLRTAAEESALEMGCTLIEMISAMQSLSAKAGDEETLEILCEIKMDIVNEM